ncbi:MAG: hypothetical protein ACOCUT_01645, partial [bacterium]
ERENHTFRIKNKEKLSWKERHRCSCKEEFLKPALDNIRNILLCQETMTKSINTESANPIDSSNTKDEIMSILDSKGINYKKSMSKEELLELLK